MEYCPFPIELCNAIMDALSEHHKFQWSWSFAESDATRSLILSLILKRSNDVFDYKGANNLFMHSFPNLRDLLCDGVRFDVAPQLSFRAMMDAVWAFPNLASLRIEQDVFGLPLADSHHDPDPSPIESGNLSVVCEYLGACRQLKKLELDQFILRSVAVAPTGASMFGYAITELSLIVPLDLKVKGLRFTLNHLGLRELKKVLKNSLPALHSISITVESVASEW
ncbi:hypothetical protein TRAPUB_553 [Trametes pubescens]|uniref:Uncharacterized protein n=1 Tax=Trametes pubescens TaxID=154538 RepID=A0A1M2VLT5_TRAPU|nr:hypothetical protein TRAPUB_553 [Trametes pubescens]